MKRTLILGYLLVAGLLFSCGDSDGFRMEEGKHSVIFQVNGLRKRVVFFTPNIVQVSCTRAGMPFRDSSLAVTALPEEVHWRCHKGKDTVVIRTDSLILHISRKSGAISFFRQDGSRWLREHDTLLPVLRDTVVRGERYFSVRQPFLLTADEGVYGLGQYQEGKMNYRHSTITLVQANTIAVVPFLYSTNGYGILWDNYSHSTFSDGRELTMFTAAVADQIDYYFVGSSTPDGVIAGYRHLTGKAPLLPKKAYGYWQSRERYASFPQMINVVERYRKEGIPVDNIVLDWMYWGDNGHWSCMCFDSASFPDPEGHIRKLHDLDVNVMVSIWPAIGTKSALYHELEKKGLLLQNRHFSGARLYDAYSPEAREIYWRYIREGLISKGVDALWMDGTEPQFRWVNTQERMEEEMCKAGMTAAGPPEKYLNTYALVTCQGVYRHFRRDVPDKRAFILTRSSWAGQQRNATVTWSGDLPSSFTSLRHQVPAGINFCMAGVPYWTHDIGGFFPSNNGGKYPEGMDDPAFRELYVRWFQFGAFSPIFRSHGTGKPRELYVFREKDPDAWKALIGVLNLRYRLMPYLYSLAWKITHDDYTLMRGLVMDFPDDANVYDIPDEYMFGPAFLVKPVIRPMFYLPGGRKIPADSVNREVLLYLPRPALWYDMWSNRCFRGGMVVPCTCSLETFPLFVRGGTIVPMDTLHQSAEACRGMPREIRIYGGQDAFFNLYFDNGRDYRYEKGEYATVSLTWKEKEHELVIGKWEGEYPFPGPSRIKVFLYEPLPGEDRYAIHDHMLQYKGEEVRLQLQ